MSDNDINKIQQNVKELQDQNAIDFQKWKKLKKDIEKLSEKIKLSDTNLVTLMKKIKSDYEKLKKIIIDENVQVQLNNEIVDNKNKIVDNKNKIEENKYEINKKVNSETFENTVDEINSQINTKAKKSDLEVQKNRIDTLIALPDGSTTADAELIDIRNGENGVKYNSSGESIRTQFSKIKDDINDIYNSFVYNISNLNLDFHNISVNNVGEIGGTNTKRATIKELIIVPNSKFLKITIKNGYMYSLYTFNLNRKFEKVDYNIVQTTNYFSGGKCYRILVSKEDNTQEITTDEANLAITIQTFFNNSANEIDVKFTNGRYVNYNDGKTYQSSFYYFTDYFIKVKNSKMLMLENLNLSNNKPNLAGIAFYDKYFNYITGEQLEKANYFSCNIPNSAIFMKICSGSNNTKLYIVNKNIKNEEFSENPIFYDGKEIAVFNNILCIGDSLTAGVFNYSENGGGLGIRSQYSYPTQLKKIIGSNVTNWGISGATTQSWYEEKIKISKWQYYDCALINLGANDIEKNSVTAASSKQYLQKIIDKLKEDNPNIKIFLMTVVPPYYNKDKIWYSTINQTRYELSKTNENCYFIDLSNYSETSDNKMYYYGHLTALGYRKLAEEIVAYISKIIAENANEFRWVQHICTSHLGE